MSERAHCPGCNSYTSSVLNGWLEAGKCPHCGLSAKVASEVARARECHVSDEIVSRYLAAEQRAETAEREAARLKRQIEEIRFVLERSDQ